MAVRPNYSELNATKVPTAIDVAWAAGVYEGEGSMRLTQKRSLSLAVPQKDAEILIRLRDWFGGSISAPVPGRPHSCHVWNCCGDRARIFVGLIYSFLSARRKVQVSEAHALEYLGETVPDGLSAADLADRLLAFNQSQKRNTWRGEDRSAIRKANYEKRKAEDVNYLKTIVLRNKEWREKQAASNVVNLKKA